MSMFKELLSGRPHRRETIAVAVAEDGRVLRAIRMAADLGAADAVLIGDVARMKEIAARESIDIGGFGLVQAADPADACRIAVGLAADGKADIVMKGIVDTSVILHAALNKEHGLRTSSLLSYVTVFEVPGMGRRLILTDAGMNIAPDVDAKAAIIRNAVLVGNALGLAEPRVACLCAVEKVNPKMPATLDAAELVRRNQAGEIANCVVSGPFALDNAISEEAARHKGITDPNAGKSDILLVPEIETGNVLYKALVFLLHAEDAGVIVGARKPIALTSRADTAESKLNSIILSILMSDKMKGTVG